MRLYSIASGSSGNCIYVGEGDTHFLVDAGISFKRIEAALNSENLTAGDLKGIFITHEHSDHISGLGVISRKHHVPIYATRETLEMIKRSTSLGVIDEELYHEIEPDSFVTIGDLTVHPFSISHDAANPVAYRFATDSKAVAVATDMGYYNEYIVSNLSGLNAVLLEANHDIRMLQTGSYPYPLKQRILSDRGHLSNETSGQLLGRILNDNMSHVLLGHLSKENNYEALAFETVRLEIVMSDNKYNGSEFDMRVARRDCPMDMIEL